MAENLVLGTWNIREFDSTKYGLRDMECLLYIAEIIDCFDLVAVQEVREDLTALNRLLDYLGGWWKCLITDVTLGRRGNDERMAFLFDSRKITFGGLASEVVIPPQQEGNKKYNPAEQLARTPYMVGFRAGWFKFTICTTHILYGTDAAEDPDRVKEIQLLAQFLADEASNKFAWSKNMILLGDFNIFKPEDQTMKAITDAGFVVPKQIQKLPSNVAQNKHYDQIAFIASDIEDDLELAKAGVFNFFNYVYRDEDEAAYAEAMGKKYADKPDASKKRRYYRDWRTYQMSDHLPMWVELKIDFSKRYLQKKLDQQLRAADTARFIIANNAM
ncbi:MAG: endonuclease/exonuclease/phosphatase family protein [Chloroflexota bacterium]|nr:endonuclease/exonuclease/phosphatase family protein [Chloroflexota bacterium]